MPDLLDGDDSSLRDTVTTSEATPLLRSDRSSIASRSSSPPSTRVSDGPDTASASDVPNQVVGRTRSIAIVISVYILIFLQASNMSGMTMAQSTIAEDLDSYEEAMWFTSAYLISSASFSPLAGRLASIFTARKMILISSVFFIAGGLVSSQAYSFSVFLLGRVLSGTGGSGIMVLAFILVLEMTSKKRRGLFVGMVNAGFTSGVSLGAVVFGALIPITGWRFLFWIQIPLGIAAGLGVYFSIPKAFKSANHTKEGSAWAKLKKVDYLGAIMLTATIVLFLYGLSGSIQVLPILISLGTLILFLLVEFFVATDPIIPFAVLQSRGALLSCFSQLGFMTARWTVLFYAPITALAVFGYSPGASGSMLLPTNLGFGIGGMLVGWLHVKRTGSFWSACLVSILLFGLSLFALSLTSNPDTPTWTYILVVFCNGLVTGATLNYTLAHMLHLTLPDTHYVATSLLGTFRSFAGSFGSAIGGGIFTRTLRHGLVRGFKALDGTDHLGSDRKELIKKLTGSPATVHNGGLNGPDHYVAVQAYVAALKVLFQAALILVAFVLIIQASTGWKGPSDKEENIEEVREAILEHDAELEA